MRPRVSYGSATENEICVDITEGYRSEAGKINALHLHFFVNWHCLDINRTAMVTLILTPFHVSRGTVP
jgi:hypothetical protein